MLRRAKFYNIYRSVSSNGTKKVADNGSSTLGKRYIENAIKISPILSSASIELWERSHETFKNHGINTDDFFHIISYNPSVLSRSPAKIIDTLEIWRSCQFGEKYFHQLIAKYPHLLDIIDSRMILGKATFLRGYVGNTKNVWKLFMSSPNLINENKNIIDEKFNYLTKIMRIEIPEIVKSEVLKRPIEEIKCRHVFLERLGLFKPRPLKAKSHDISKNSKLYEIMDTTDMIFVTKIANVTLEEFETFQELFSKELESLNDDDNENEFSDEET